MLCQLSFMQRLLTPNSTDLLVSASKRRLLCWIEEITT